jgi:hypothetical protein
MDGVSIDKRKLLQSIAQHEGGSCCAGGIHGGAYGGDLDSMQG